MLIRISLSFVLMTSTLFSLAQEAMPLYTGKIPNSFDVENRETRAESGGIVRIGKISQPTIAVYLPAKEKANGTAVVIFPGGGYGINAIQHEGYDVAKQLNDWGIAAFVVKYRIPDSTTMPDPSIGPLQDAQQAMLMVRENASKWGVDSNRVGIIGFSAGGHLASTLGTHYQKSLVPNPKNLSIRPSFMILVYPVISSDSSIWHKGSFMNLLGKNPKPAALNNYSNEKQVTADTPPTFLVHAGDDKVVPVENSIRMYTALKQSGVLAEMHIYEKGGHGFGLVNKQANDSWVNSLRNWLKLHDWVR